MIEISVLEVVVCLSEIIDLMCEEIKDHHKRVACGAYHLAKAAGMEGVQLRDTVVAAALHDIGGLSLEARKCAALHFEDTNSHAERGYKLLSVFEPFANAANIIRYHHTKWNYGKGHDVKGGPIPLESQVLLMADRISVLLSPGVHTLNQVHAIVPQILAKEGDVYQPELVDLFREVAKRDVFWLDIMSQEFYNRIFNELNEYDIRLADEHVDEMLDLLSNIVDFRSVFTTVHSKGVSAVAQELAQLMGLNEEDCYTMKVAALMHDIGKLAIPTEILEKPGPLSEYERDVIRSHSYHTDRVISRLSGFEKIRKWASYHHENLDGTGYPFGIKEAKMNLGAKIMKVADVFVAITENRPYRAGMSGEEALYILRTMVEDGEVDGAVVQVLSDNAKSIGALREKVEEKALRQYAQFMED